jgi:hypothetical protein
MRASRTYLRQWIGGVFRFSTLWLVVMGLFAADDIAALQLGPLSIAAGPWMQVDDRGLITVSVRLLPPINQAALALVQPYIGQARVPAPMISRMIPPVGGMLAGQIVAHWTLPPLTSGRVRLGADPRSPSVEVPVLPGPSEAVAVALVGGARWPTADLFGISAEGPPAADILVAPKASGRLPVSAVLLLGTAPLARIGTGGWESRVPIIARLAPPHSGDEVDLMQLAILGPPGVPGADLTWGCLGLPSLLRGPEVAVDLARRTRAWEVLLDPSATWDVSLRAARDRHDVENLRLGVGIAHMLGIPCILAGGSPAGFISEPMITGKLGGMEVVTGGVRYVSSTPAGDGVRSLDAHIAVTLDAPATAIIQADPEHLSWSLAEGPGELALRWSHDANLAESGPGRADCLALTAAWRATQAKKPAAKEEKPPSPAAKEAVVVASDPLLAWVPRRELVVGEWSLIELFALADSPSATDHLLARRLVADPWLVGDEEALLRRLPDWLQREALLRWMAEPDAPAHAWVRVAGSTKDTGIVRALLANVEHGGSPVILEVLVERLTAQAAGRIPIDDDPMLQSRLTAAVFDADTLSPTPLRAIARDLEKRLSPLGQKPVTRFLERVGRFRPVP